MNIQIFFLFSSIYFFTIAPNMMDRFFMAGMLAITGLSIINCYRIKELNPNIRGQYLRHSFLFLLGFCIVFYQYIIDYVTHFIEHPDDVQSLIWYDQAKVCKALCLANVALNSFLIGYLYIKKRYKERQYSFEFCQFRNLELLYFICWCLVILYIITIDKTYLFNGYGKNAQMGDSAFHLSIWIQGVLIAYVVMKSYQMKQVGVHISLKKYLRDFSRPLILCLIMTILILMSGRRTEAIRFILLLIISYIYIRNYKIHLVKLIIPIIILGFTFSVLAMIRIDGNATISEASDIIFNANTIFPPTQELAFNISSLHIALANIPDNYPYLYGIPTIIGFATIIPGLQPLVISYCNIPEIFQNSATLICFAAVGEVRYYSLGTSILADAYINFGIAGIVFVPLVLGVVLRKLEDYTFTDSRKSIYVLGISFSFFTNLLYMCRGTITSPIASLSYVLLLTFIISSHKKISH